MKKDQTFSGEETGYTRELCLRCWLKVLDILTGVFSSSEDNIMPPPHIHKYLRVAVKGRNSVGKALFRRVRTP